jgi:heme oxygenase
MRVLLRGQMTRSAYCTMLCNLHAIYAALEPALARHAVDPRIASIIVPGVGRVESLEDDLQTLHGPGWRSELTIGRCAVAYVRRLHEIESIQPGLLMAHAYVRYLGDLSGGQMLRRIVARSMSLVDGSGTAFYEFGDATQTKALAQAFREGLVSIALEPAAADAVVEEAAWSFRMHRYLFFELAGAARLLNGHASRVANKASPSECGYPVMR